MLNHKQGIKVYGSLRSTVKIEDGLIKENSPILLVSSVSNYQVIVSLHDFITLLLLPFNTIVLRSSFQRVSWFTKGKDLGESQDFLS